VAQVKKEEVRAAILAAAYRLFRKQGYIDTTVNEIAEAAGTSRANIYVYFRSKFALFYSVFDPWLQRRLSALERELAGVAEPDARLRRILTALWRDIPGEANGFANNLMQALSTASPEDRYSPALLRAVEARVAGMIAGCIAPARRGTIDSRALAHIAFMAFDGFAMHAHLKTRDACGDAIIETMSALLLNARAKA
jgi:AcrR family transcriptional regulator